MRVSLIVVRQALEREEITPCFQPLVELRTGRLTGFEVLARWKHPDFGLILPENLISLAEENGLIGTLSRQIMQQAFRAAPMLPEPLVLAVNFSPIQLHYLSLPTQIRAVAEEEGFPLQRLMVEITETALVGNLEKALKIATELKAMGCKLALDDFGTGYSSLRHLQTIPFDELKVDRSFVESMMHRRESRKIVAAVVGLGHSLGMTTLAEGVETEKQAEMLLNLGCEMGQGWLYGHPLPADRIPEMVEAASRAQSAKMASTGDEGTVAGLEALPAQRMAQLQAIYNGAPVGLCFFDRNLRYVSLNQRYANLHGTTIAAHIGRTMQEMIPGSFSRVQHLLLRALQGESIEAVEVLKPSPRPGEPDLTTLVSYEPAFDEAHEVIGVSVAIVDITDRKKAEQALRESEENYKHLVELSPQIPWIADAGGNLIEISSQWTRLTGMSKEQSLNRGWMAALHPEDLPSTIETIRTAVQTGESLNMEHRVRTSDGRWKWLRVRGAALRGSSGEVLRWYGSLEDIDERKQLEEAAQNPPVAGPVIANKLPALTSTPAVSSTHPAKKAESKTASS